MYNLLEYSKNYKKTIESLYNYYRDELDDDADLNNHPNNNVVSSNAFQYKNKLLGNTYNVDLSKVTVVTLSKEDNKDFIEQRNKEFQRSIYWSECKTKDKDEDGNANVTKYISLDPSFQGVNRLFLMAYSREANQPTRNGHQKYYLPRVDLKKYNFIIDGRNFYDNPIKNNSEKYRELKKVMIGKGEDYTTGSLLDYNYFTKHYKLVAVDLSKQKELDADPRAIQQIEFKYTLETNSTIKH